MEIAFVPARSGSKRLKDKNILKLNNESLIKRTVKNMIEVGFDRIVLSSDNEKYFQEVDGMTVECDLRPKKYSKDNSSSESTLVNWVNRSVTDSEALIYFWQVTSPFRTQKLILDFKKEARKLKFGEVLVCFSRLSKISKLENNAIIPLDYRFGERGQDLNFKIIKENGLGYALSRSTLIKHGFFGNKIIPFFTDDYCLDLDIDTQVDYNMAKILIENGFQDR